MDRQWSSLEASSRAERLASSPFVIRNSSPSSVEAPSFPGENVSWLWWRLWRLLVVASVLVAVVAEHVALELNL
jgi:hypothetical protein